MEIVEIERVNSWIGKCTDIFLRETEQVRLVFRPEVVQNTVNPKACLHGRFLYQRKSKKDEWENVATQPLSTIKSGEQFQLVLDSKETHLLLTRLGALWREYRQHGIPQGKRKLVELEEPLAKLLQLSEADFNKFLSDHPSDAVETLKRVIRWLSQSPSAAQKFAEEDQLPELNALVNLANLRALLKVWRDNDGNDNEEFWQQEFAKHNYVLSQLFAYPVVTIEDKAYVGGKRHDNKHGSVADFLGRVEFTGASVIIEIKTPNKSLLGPCYRQDVFPPSNDVTGALSQVLHYRENLMSEMHAIMQGQPDATLCEPRCIIIVGHAQRELIDKYRQRSFERFRERLAGITLVTFDEVFSRVASMISLLEAEDGMFP